MGKGGQIWLKCITVDLIMMIKYKNNIFERVKKNHADLAGNYPETLISRFGHPNVMLYWSDQNAPLYDLKMI